MRLQDDDADRVLDAHAPPLLQDSLGESLEEKKFLCLIDGDAAWQDSWDVVQMLIIGYIFLELPLRLGFRWTKGEGGIGALSEAYMTPATDLIIDALMLIDLISRFFTTYTWHDFYGEDFVVRDQVSPNTSNLPLLLLNI